MTVLTGTNCPWQLSVQPPSATWLRLGTSSGTDTGTGTYEVLALGLGVRSADIQLNQAPSNTCHVDQGLGLVRNVLRLTGDLDLAGATIQVVWNESDVRYYRAGRSLDTAPHGAGSNRVVAQVVSADGKPGTWTVTLDGRVKPGSLRALAGHAQTSPDTITFRFTGKAGERVVFAFEAEP